jgi:hypothetical protein
MEEIEPTDGACGTDWTQWAWRAWLSQRLKAQREQGGGYRLDGLDLRAEGIEAFCDAGLDEVGEGLEAVAELVVADLKVVHDLRREQRRGGGAHCCELADAAALVAALALKLL